MRRATGFLFLVLSLTLPAGGSAAGERLALLVGIGGYEAPGLSLKNPANDVRALAPLLESLGFEISVLVDPGIAELRGAIGRFAGRARGTGIAAIFFAGHGLQIAGENLLLAADLPAPTLEDIAAHSIRLSEIRDLLAEARPEIAMILLDSCREVPAPQAMLPPDPGLAIERRSFPGYLIAYATDPGNVAADGEGDNSAFTAALIEHLPTPGLDIRLVFGRIRQDVVLATGGAQVPWVEESLLGPLVLGPSAGPASPAMDEIALWRRLSESGRAEDLRRYLAAHPEGLFAELAEVRLAAPASPKTASELDMPEEELGQLSAALSVLGYLPGPPGTEFAPPAIRSAAAAYLQAGGSLPARLEPERLYAEAARVTVLTGAFVSQRLRVQIGVLEAFETLVADAKAVQAEMRRTAGQDPAYVPVLAEAAAIVAELEARRAEVLRLLDETRAYYRSQLDLAAARFSPYLTESVLRLDDGDTRGIAAGARLGVAEDARRFLRHVAIHADGDRRGSVAWLTDFLGG